jgi:DNA-directed RNA polymerase specialized sigma24 family protein
VTVEDKVSTRSRGETDPIPPPTPRSLSEEPTWVGPEHAASPLELAIGCLTARRYEEALLSLPPRDRRAVRGRIEQQQSYDSLAEALGLATATAARAAVVRALGRLIEAMSP